MLAHLASLAWVSLISAGIATAAPPCSKPEASEPVITHRDFHWKYSLDEMVQKAQEMYESPKRLAERAYFSPEKGAYVLEIPVFNGRESENKPVAVPPNFIASVTRHVEKALETGYASHVFFPDLGHSHFLLPQRFYEEQINPLPVFEYDELYRRIFSEASVRILYHTAEQLKMAEWVDGNVILSLDPKVLWRYFTRNLIGDNGGGENVEIRFAANEKYNTLHELEGYFYWGAGFNISANKDGCFPFRHAGETRYFDLSMKDLE